MRRSVSNELIRDLLAGIERPGTPPGVHLPAGGREPVHTVYGGAHLFTAETPAKLGRVALGVMDEYAPDFCAFARMLGMPESAGLPAAARTVSALAKRLGRIDAHGEDAASTAWAVYTRVREKLACGPVEDYRVDFEDGFGPRSDEEEDAAAVRVAHEMAKAVAAGTLPAFAGIRVRPFGPVTGRRSARTLDLFVTALAEATNGRVPRGMLIALPKVTAPDEVEALATMLGWLERSVGLGEGTFRIEIMVETPESLVTRGGRLALPLMREAAGGRLAAAHLGAYDLTAALNVPAQHQGLGHPVCVTARQLMQLAFAGTEVRVVDGVTAVLPVPPHRVPAGARLTARQRKENRAAVTAAWQAGWADVVRAQEEGIYQGWDLHPAQLPVRYAAVIWFFRRNLESTARRLRAFVDEAARARVSGTVFDDAATGQGMLNFFLRGLACGALTPEESARAGLTPAELSTRSFDAIFAGRTRTG
jgi:citrate lyase beta subunit